MATLQEVYKAICESLQRGDAVCVATVIATAGSTPRESGAKMVIWENGRSLGSVGGGQLELRVMEAAKEVFRSGRPALLHFALKDEGAGDPGICGGDADVFLELAGGKLHLVVIGGGHVGQALSRMAALAGFRVTVMDDRDLDSDLFPDEVELMQVEDYGRLPLERVGRTSCVAVMTPEHAADREALRQLVDLPLAYLGMIGSRRKVAATFQHLRDDSVTEESLSRVHAPIGLDIGADTPEEIAISILAEIVQVLKGRVRETVAGPQTPRKESV